MNRQEIIQMAKEAGLDLDGENIFSPKSDPQVDVHIADLEVFANLVASAEREACANSMAKIVMIPTYTHGALVKLSDVVNAIRARGQA